MLRSIFILCVIGFSGIFAGSAVADPSGATPRNPSSQTKPAAQTGDEALGSFTVLASNDSGKTLFIAVAPTPSVESLIYQTATELGKIFDGKPTLAGGFIDTRTKRRGGGTFTAMLKGEEVRGIIICGSDEKGSAASVIYSRANAPQSAVAALFDALPVMAKVQPYRFPDGSGTIDLAAGWTTDAPSLLGGNVFVTGPQGQTLTQYFNLEFCTPDSQAMQVYGVELRSSQQFHKPPPRMPFCSRYVPPANVLDVINTRLNRVRQMRGQPTCTIDRIIECSPLEPTAKGASAGAAEAALVLYEMTSHGPRGPMTYRSLARFECTMFNRTAWTVTICECMAPVAIFYRDLPLMRQMMGSVHVDPATAARIGAVVAQQIIANSQFVLQQQQTRFNTLQREDTNRQEAFHKSNLDFIEMIGGCSTLVNTQTGQTASTNYYNVNQTISSLNQGNAGLYQHVPLRQQY